MPTKALRLSFVIVLIIALFVPISPKYTANASSLDISNNKEVAATNLPAGDSLAEIAARVSAGWAHTCALTTSGGVKCWGYNNGGQLGDGTTINRSTPVDVQGLISGVSAITAGDYHTCALTTSGGVKCWGLNDFGQLGDGTTTSRFMPVDVQGLTSGVNAIAAGTYHTCALTNYGGVKCWGLNASSQLGDGTTTNRLFAVGVQGLASGIRTITSGSYHTCAVTTSGGAMCWGSNSYGQLGDGTTTIRSTPVDVQGLASGVNAITAGWTHTCVLTISGGVKCWGYNSYGQLGDGTTINRSTPVDVQGLTSGASVITGGDYHTCALTTSGGVKCWGCNDGQLGDGTTTSRSMPADVKGLTSRVSAITAGWRHTCAVSISGGVKCWGDNSLGQLGDGTATNRFTPVDVVGFGGEVPKAWTLMYYIAADNDKDQEARLFYQYIKLIQSSNNPNINVIGFWDGVDTNARYVTFSPDGFNLVLPKGELNTGDPTTLNDFVSWAQQSYPADHFALIISDHGSGVSGLAYDHHIPGEGEDFLTPSKIRQALSTATKLDIIYMDACLMATLESMYQLRDLADYYIGSESVTWGSIRPDWYSLGHQENGDGWKINIQGIQGDTTPVQLATAIAQSYSGLAKNIYRRPSTISVVNIRSIEDVASKTSSLSLLLKNQMSTLRDTIREIKSSSVLQHFDMNGDNEITDSDEYIDLYHFASLVNSRVTDSDIQSAAQQLMASLETFVIYQSGWGGAFMDKNENSHTWYHDSSHGVSIFFPTYSRSFYKTGWLDFTAGTTWDISGQSVLFTDEVIDTPIEWGPMLVEYVRQTNPTTPDDPNPPELMAPESLLDDYFYLPVIIRR